jgi:DNA-binding transcriptional LysR family regulator
MRMPGPDLLKTFVTVAGTGSFTLAAQRLALSQSTVSQQIKRLEDILGRTVLARDTHSVALTPDGDALLGFARQLLNAHDNLHRFFEPSSLTGRLRFGVSEDFGSSGLEDVLSEFSRRHPAVELELMIGLSVTLYERFDSGDLDVLFVKRRFGDARGQVAWREQLAWIGRPGIRPDPNLPLPLLLYPPPSITRTLALQALDRVGRAWRTACTSGSLSGLHAAARGGLGVAPHSARLLPPDLSIVPFSRFLPELSDVEFVVISSEQQHATAPGMTDVILENVNGLRSSGILARD